MRKKMTKSNSRLTEEEKNILGSYKAMIRGLGDYLGEGYELVLHSLEDLDHSAVLVVNGQHSGRKEGAPITDLALSMLDTIQESDRPDGVTYWTRNKNGEPLRSCTLPIYGPSGRIIGLICINFYLNMPFDVFLDSFRPSQPKETTVEHFENDTEAMINKAVATASGRVLLDESISPSARNKEIIQRLENEGIFKMKNAVEFVASVMGISKNTVYLHLRNSRIK